MESCTKACLRALTMLLIVTSLINAQESKALNASYIPHSRQKRLLFLTDERRLTLPPETLLVLTPTLSVPLKRNLPTGYGASMTLSLPFKISFDDLGLTSEENPWGTWPDFTLLFRKKRDAFQPLPGVNFAGGDREMMYQIVEDGLANMGFLGKPCLLRAICEIFQMPFVKHGFVGEVLELFFSASRAPHAEKRLTDYTRAERIGRSTGECFEYHLECPFSLFSNPGILHWETEEEDAHKKYHGPESSTYTTTPVPSSSSSSQSNDFFEDIQRQASASVTKKEEDKKPIENTKKRKNPKADK